MTGKGKGNRNGGRPLSDATLTVGIKQGAGATVPVAFGAPPTAGRQKGPPGQARKRQNRRKMRQGRNPGLNLAVWDAFAEPHLALPRAVAPYTVIRTTAVWGADAEMTADQRRFVLLGPMMDVSRDGGQWMNGFAIGPKVAMSDPMNTANGASLYTFASMNSESWKAASITPAAFTIQVLNPDALQETNGMLYMGRCKQKLNLGERDLTKSFKSLADELVAYSNPRMCSAGKLALRGVQCDGVPNNMSEIAKFTSINQRVDSQYNISPTNVWHHEGFNPIFIYNPNAVKIQILVCCEWRVRFDPSNPAYASCRMRKPTSDASWASHLERAVSMGSGVVDIVENVARLGRAVGYI
jgi:hypothetical protein